MERLKPFLVPRGFTWRLEHVGVAMGAFANGFFVGEHFSIGLIWRESSGLGLPNYSTDRANAERDSIVTGLRAANTGHDLVMEGLGFAGTYRLRWDGELPTSVYSVTGEPLVDAFIADLQLLIPIIETRPQDIRRVILEAHAAWVRKLYGK